MSLRDEIRSAVQRYARNIGDDGQVPEGLVSDLVLIAEQHATRIAGDTLTSVQTTRPRGAARKTPTRERTAE